MATPPTGMDKAPMKALLMKSKADPVQCAIGLGSDPGVALLLLDKTKSAKAVEKMLNDNFKDAKNVRFGSVVVDAEADPKLVKFTLNRPVSGMAVRLVKTLKGTGFSKVQLCGDDGAEFDSHGETGEDAEAAASATQETSTSELATQESATDPAAEIAALHQQLAGLIRALPAAAGTDKSRMDTLHNLAVTANDAIKKADATAAAAAIDSLKAAIDAKPATAAPPTPAPGGFVAMQKSRLVWDATRKKVATDINRFKDAVAAAFEDDPEATTMLDALDQLDDILYHLDERLLDALDAALSEHDAAKHAALVAGAKDLMDEYLHYVQSDAMIGALAADNPLGVTLNVGPMVATTIKAMRATLQ